MSNNEFMLACLSKTAKQGAFIMKYLLIGLIVGVAVHSVRYAIDKISENRKSDSEDRQYILKTLNDRVLYENGAIEEMYKEMIMIKRSVKDGTLDIKSPLIDSFFYRKSLIEQRIKKTKELRSRYKELYERSIRK